MNYEFIKASYVVWGIFFAIGVLILLVAFSMFFPKRRFKRKKIKASDATSRLGRELKFLYYFLLFFIALGFIALSLYNFGGTKILDLEISRNYLLLSALIILVLMIFVFGRLIDSKVHSLIGCRSPNLEGEVGKLINEGKIVIIYFFNLDAFREELKMEEGWWKLTRKDPEKEIQDMEQLIEKVKSIKKITVFKMDPMENEKVFNKFKLPNAITSLLRLVTPYSSRIDIPSIVIISEGYIKEHWIGYNECKSGLMNFDIKKLGMIDAVTMRTKIIDFIGVSLFLIFVGFLSILLLGYIDYLFDKPSFLSLIIFLGLPILILIISQIPRIR